MYTQPITGAAAWKMWEPMGPAKLKRDVAEEFVVRLQDALQKRDRGGGGKLNAAVHFSVALNMSVG